VKDKDRDFLFEAYKKIYETPIDPGGAWDTEDVPSQFDAGEIERLAKYQVETPEKIQAVVDAVKNFLAQHENSHYPGTYKDFKSELIDDIRNAVGIGTANGKYVSRVVTNALKRLDVISVDGATQQVQVGNVPEAELENEIEDKVESVIEIQQRHTYEIGTDSNTTPDSDADMAHALLKKEIGARFSATGRQILDIIRKEVGFEEAKVLTTQLLQSDGIIIPETEDDEEDKMPDIGDDSFRRDDAGFIDDYARANFGTTPGGMGGSMSDY
jgi:hypothetical protein